jgi:ABC-type uncharacterized transport system YnjBCD permease subunit
MNHWLFSKKGLPSKTAFWFSTTMATTLALVICITIRFLVKPSPEFTNGLTGIAVVLGIPNAILATAYTWGKKIDQQN